MLVAAALTVLVAGGVAGCGGQSYSCGTGSSGHCYGTVTWTGNPTGFSMEEVPVSLTSGNIFVDDEGWLVDYETGVSFGAYWVETGEINEGSGTDYFWANNTAAGGFMFFDLGPVAASDISSGAWIAYQVRQDPAVTSQWDVSISRASSGTLLYSAQSTNNPMHPNTVLEGQELAGEMNAQAPLTFFSENAVFQGSTETLRSTDGTVRRDAPPNAGWFPTSNMPSQTHNGGLFFTDCC